MNIILIPLVLWGYLNIHFSSKQIFFTEVQHNLIELEGLINNQQKKNWPEPNLVTSKLSKVLNGIYVGVQNGKYLHTLSQEERYLLEKLASRLRQYPHDELYQFSKVTDEDKRHFEELRLKLREAEIGLGITMWNDWDTFMIKMEILEKSLKRES